MRLSGIHLVGEVIDNGLQQREGWHLSHQKAAAALLISTQQCAIRNHLHFG